MNTEQLRKLMEQDKLIIGKKQVKSALESGDSKHLVIASNAQSEDADIMKKYASMTGAQVTQLDARNDEVGVMVRKPFSISFLAVKE